MKKDRDYHATMKKYAQKVMSGKIPASVYTKAGILRHLDDLERKDIEWQFYPEMGAKQCGFSEVLRVGSEFGVSYLRLADWEVFWVMVLNGWGRYVEFNGSMRWERRFQSCYLTVAKKNGKTTLAATEMLGALTYRSAPSTSVICAATKLGQAVDSLNKALQIIKLDEELAHKFNIKALLSTAYREDIGVRMFAITGKASGLDGQNVRFALVDEYHEHRDSLLLDSLRKGLVAQVNGFLMITTTAGYNTSSVCFFENRYAIEILNSTIINHPEIDFEVKGNSKKNDRHLIVMYTLDPEDDYNNKKIWVKANPSLGVDGAVTKENVSSLLTEAMGKGTLNAWLTKHMNMWVKGKSQWLPLSKWDAWAQPVSIEEMSTLPYWVGVDLSSTQNLTGISVIFQEKTGVYRLYTFPWLPSESVSKYGECITEDMLKTSEDIANPVWSSYKINLVAGHVIDQTELLEFLKNFVQNFPYCRGILFDTWNAGYLSNQVKNEIGVPVLLFSQRPSNFTEPMRAMERAVFGGKDANDIKIYHDNSPIMRLCIGYTIPLETSNKTIRPIKENDADPIDLVVSTLMALGGALQAEEEEIPFKILGAF